MDGESHRMERSPAGAPMFHDCLADKLGLWLRVAHKTFTDTINSEFHRYRVTQLDFLVLTLIAAVPGCRQTAISQRLDIKSPNLAVAIDYLVQRGFVSKIPDPIDRRANHLNLTESGNAFVKQLSARYSEITREVFSGHLDQQNEQNAIALLRFIARHANKTDVVHVEVDDLAVGARANLAGGHHEGVD